MKENLVQQNSFHCKKRLIPFVKEPFLDSNGNEIMKVYSKFSWFPKFKFMIDEDIVYSAILKNSSGNLLKKEFIIYNRLSNETIAIVREKSLHKKKTIFTEYDICIGNKSYQAKYEVMSRGFSITDINNTLCVKGVKTNFIISDIFKNRSYNIEISSNEFSHFIWLAIVKGMQILE